MSIEYVVFKISPNIFIGPDITYQYVELKYQNFDRKKKNAAVWNAPLVCMGLGKGECKVDENTTQCDSVVGEKQHSRFRVCKILVH